METTKNALALIRAIRAAGYSIWLDESGKVRVRAPHRFCRQVGAASDQVREALRREAAASYVDSDRRKRLMAAYDGLCRADGCPEALQLRRILLAADEAWLKGEPYRRPPEFEGLLDGYFAWWRSNLQLAGKELLEAARLAFQWEAP